MARYEKQPDTLWRARIEGLPEVYVAARTLQGAKEQIRKALAARQQDLTTVEVTDHVELSEYSRQAVQAAMEARERAMTTADEAARRMREAAEILLKEGFSFRDAGLIIGVSHTRVQQLTEPLAR